MVVEVGPPVEEFGPTVRLWMSVRNAEAGPDKWHERSDDEAAEDAQETCLAVSRCCAGADAADARKQYFRFLWPDASPCGGGSPCASPLAKASIRYPEGHPGQWLLTERLADQLSDFLPACLRFQSWTCVFSPRLHGVSLHTLYRCFERSPSPSVVLVRDSGGRLFGGFAGEPWRNAGRFYGSGECFVFSADAASQDKRGKHRYDLRVYSWSGRKRFFMFSDASTLAMGEGGREAISIRDDLLSGTSSPCETFASPVLSSQMDFVIEDIEFWGFEFPGSEDAD